MLRAPGGVTTLKLLLIFGIHTHEIHQRNRKLCQVHLSQRKHCWMEEFFLFCIFFNLYSHSAWTLWLFTHFRTWKGGNKSCFFSWPQITQPAVSFWIVYDLYLEFLTKQTSIFIKYLKVHWKRKNIWEEKICDLRTCWHYCFREHLCILCHVQQLDL